MFVHTLEFTSRRELARAFDCVIGSEFVEDCLVELPRRTLRFVAPPEHASRLIERLYLDGGLVWCQRSKVER